MAGLYALAFWGGVGCLIASAFLSFLVNNRPGAPLRKIKFIALWIIFFIVTYSISYYLWLKSLGLTPFDI